MIPSIFSVFMLKCMTILPLPLSCRLPSVLVTKSTLEVVIPKHAVPSLIMRSGSKLAQISEVILQLDFFFLLNYLGAETYWSVLHFLKQISGATVTLVKNRPEQPKRVVQISGSPEQAERAQSLLQGFILSSKLWSIFFPFSGRPFFQCYCFKLSMCFKLITLMFGCFLFKQHKMMPLQANLRHLGLWGWEFA